MRRFTEGDKRLSSAYNFDFLYAQSLSPARVRRAQSNWATAEDGWPSWAFSNHDAPRCVSRWADAQHREAFAKLTNTLLLCLRGNPILYQGEELGLTQVDVAFEDLQDPEAIANWPLTLGRDGARTPMPWGRGMPHAGFSDTDPWLPLGVDHPDLAVDRQACDPKSVLSVTRAFIAMRKTSTALRYGEIRFEDTGGPILAFCRVSVQETLLCIFNLGEEFADVGSLELVPSARLFSTHPGVEIESTLSPYEARIYRLP